MSPSAPSTGDSSAAMGLARTNEQLIEGMDALHAHACAAHRDLFGLIVEADRAEAWRDSGARDLAHWLCMRYGMSSWKASRWIAAAHALEGLPLLSGAFASGIRWASTRWWSSPGSPPPETEERLIVWAQGVSCACIREKGDLLHRSLQEAREAEHARSLSWWYFAENSRFGLFAELPAAEGAVVAKALEHLADRLPVMPGEDREWSIGARRADALVALCSSRIASDPDPDRATVVIHARLDGPGGELHSCEVEGGPAIHPETARRLLCTSRVQVVLEDRAGQPVRLGRISREPPDWMMRQLRYRDRECTFHGCGYRRYTQAHHIVWWEHGGRTELRNLILVCNFHHKLVHE